MNTASFKHFFILKEDKKEDYYKPEKVDYSFSSLEPFTSEETMNVHYNKHYKGYIKKCNELVKRPKPLEEMAKEISKYNDVIRFNIGGALNHSIWFQILKKDVSLKGSVEELIKKKFGSYKNFKKEFEEKAFSIMGSGWCWLTSKGEIVVTSNQDNPLMFRYMGNPILGLDLWEHSFYLDYQSDKKEYINNFFKCINWDFVNSLLEKE
jgi:Fe-Mn family superoxide dismutase